MTISSTSAQLPDECPLRRLPAYDTPTPLPRLLVPRPASLFAKQPYRHLASFDSRPTQDLDNALHQGFGDIHEREALLDLNRPDDIGIYFRFIGNGADEIAWPDARVPSRSHIDACHASLSSPRGGSALREPVDWAG